MCRYNKAIQGLSSALEDAPALLIALAKGEVSASAIISAGVGSASPGPSREGHTPGSGLRAMVGRCKLTHDLYASIGSRVYGYRVIIVQIQGHIFTDTGSDGGRAG